MLFLHNLDIASAISFLDPGTYPIVYGVVVQHTNITKRKTETDDYKSAYTHLTNLIAGLNSQTSTYLIQELLTGSEQIMVIKRFAAIFMFNEGFTPYRVSETFSLSTSSVHRLYLRFENGSFDNLLGCIKKKEVNRFLALINDIITSQVDMKARTRLMNRTQR